MPIYAYRCSNCGHAQDVLQKISDPVLSVCPACGQPSYVKQVTAAGFQLKGSGWYVTDFRGGDNKGGGKADDAGAGEGKGKGGEPKPEGGADAGAAAAGAAADSGKKSSSEAPAPAPAAAPSSSAPAASPVAPGKTGG